MRQPTLALAVVGALLIAGLVAYTLRRPAAVTALPHAAKMLATPADTGGGEDMVKRALRLASIDPKHKDQWVDDIPDLDLAALAPGPRALFLRVANGRRCDCGCGFTLAGCRRFDDQCEFSGPRARALYDSVKAGRIARADGYPERPKI
jgi:hypothetical protein